jgi:hypothetical protein
MARSRRALLAIEFIGDAAALEEHHPAASERSLVLNNHLAAFDGKLLGAPDGPSVVLFPDVTVAVRCAASLQSSINGTKTNGSPSAAQSSPRIGVVDLLADELGEYPSVAEIEAAIKMMRAAESGGLCLSRTAYDAVKFDITLPFDDRSDPAHTAYQCGEIRKKRHSMDLALMSAVKVGPDAFRDSSKGAIRPAQRSLGVSRLLQGIAAYLGFRSKHDGARDLRGK